MNLISQDYLMHHGVKGMKWGVRNDRRTELRNNLRRAKTEYRQAKRKTDWSFGGHSLIEKRKATSKAAVKVMNADVAYNVGKSKSKPAADKAEFNAYTRAIRKNGLVGSLNDSLYGGTATNIYNEIKKKKGKAYADRVESRAKKQLIGTIVGSLAVTAGANVVSYYMYS